MDFDPRITSDGNGYGAAHGVHCNFHCGNVHDLFDEHAKNEAACVQALHHLIAKADSEIDDLEDELAVVQCQRKLSESVQHRSLFEVCCAAFKRRIDSLTSTLQRLRNGVDTVSDIQRPAEKICDIIDALIKSNVTELDEQEGDVDSEKEQAVSCNSLRIYTDVRAQTTTLESSLESEKQTPDPEKLEKPTQIVSEESCSDAARFTTTDMPEVISTDLPDVEVFEQIENAEHASEEKTVFSTNIDPVISTNIEPVTSQSPFQASNGEVSIKPTGPLCGEIESCMGGSKTGESKAPILVAKTEVIVKVEHDHDTNIQHDSVVEGELMALENQSQSVSDLEIKCGKKKIDHDTNIQHDSAVEGCLKALENQSQSISDLEITYGRKKSDHNTNIQHDSAVEGRLMAIENQYESISDLEITYGRKKSDHDTNIQHDSAVEGLMAVENPSQSISDFDITYGRKKSDRDTNIQQDSAVEGRQMALENPSQSISDFDITYGRKKSDHDSNIQHDSAVEGHLMALENQSQSIADLEITYGRKRSNLSTILKPPGKKVRKKVLDDVRTITPRQMLVPKKTITKRKFSSIKSSLSSEIDKSYRFLLETEENAELENPLQVLHAKKRQPKETKVDFPDILSSEVNVPEGSLDTKGAKVDFPDILSLEANVAEGSLDAKVSVAPNSSSKITVRPKSLNRKSPNAVEVKETVITSSADTLTPGCNNPIVENTKAEIPEFDLESLKVRRSEPNFLTNLKAQQLRKIAKLLNLRGYSKFKKDKLIEGLSERLATL